MSNFFQYGEKVHGYDVLVLNEREARAAAGILFAVGIIALTNSVMLGHAIMSKFFIAFFAIDFIIRVIQPAYSPSMLVGRFFVRNQTPEYVGAAQKRFAWTIGVILVAPMFYYLVILWQPDPLKVFVCVFCLVLLFLESAFSFCLGCTIYNLIKKDKATNCPGGVCEMKIKEPIQKFNAIQSFIAIFTVTITIYGAYLYMDRLDNKTMIGEIVGEYFLSEQDILDRQNKEFDEQVSNFDEDDDF
jgi:hypothetical protein